MLLPPAFAPPLGSAEASPALCPLLSTTGQSPHGSQSACVLDAHVLISNSTVICVCVGGVLCACVCVRARVCIRTCSVVSDSLQPHGLEPARLLCSGILQASILEWAAISCPRGFSCARDQAHVSWVSCTGRRILYPWATWEALLNLQRGCITSLLTACPRLPVSLKRPARIYPMA